MRRTILVIVIMAILAGSVWATGVWRAVTPRPQAVASTDLTGSGIIQAQQDVVISAEVGGHVLALSADEGDDVEAGTVLVRLDEDLLLAQMAQAQAVVEAAEANLVSAKAGALAPEIEAARAVVDRASAQARAAGAGVDIATANLRAAQAAYEAAQARLARLAAGASERELELARLQTDLARNALWEMQARRDTTRSGMDDPISVPVVIGDFDLGSMVVANPGAPGQWDLDLAEGTVSGAESAVAVADMEYDQLKAGPRVEDVAIMWAQVVRAEADQQVAQVQLEQTRQAVRVAIAQVQQSQAQLGLAMAAARPEGVAVAKAQLDQATAEAVILEVQRDKLSLRTPIAGVVTQRTVHEGETVIPGARLFTISTLDPAILTIYIPEDRIGRVHLGQIADVRVDAYPGRTFQGQVVHIASRAEFTPRNVRTKEERVTTVFAVDIKIANPDRLLRPGMPADATCVEKGSMARGVLPGEAKRLATTADG